MKLRILDDYDVVWFWDGERLVAEGDDTEGGGYPASTFEEVYEALEEGSYIAIQDVVDLYEEA